MKLITKTRLLKVPSDIDGKVVLFVQRNQDEVDLIPYGLNLLTEVGQILVPNGVGAASRRNIHGDVIVHKDQEQVWREFYLPWYRSQFVTGGGRETVFDEVLHRRLCYPRTEFAPHDVEIMLTTNVKGEQVFASPTIDSSDKSKLLTAINLFLEIFGSVHIAKHPDDDLVELVRPDRSLAWRIFPEAHPLSEVVNSVAGVRVKPAYKDYLEHRLKHINRYPHQEVVVGQGGLSGYVAFVFKDQAFTLLECVHPNNATYILRDNWERISQLSKKEILEHRLGERIIHNGSWVTNIENLFTKKQAA